MDQDSELYNPSKMIILVVALSVIAAFGVYVFNYSRSMPYSRPSCQRNMKELGTALALYMGDYDGMLPSSGLNGSKVWNPADFTRFATKRGILPPPANSQNTTWPMLLHTHMKNTDIIWCNHGRQQKVLFWERYIADKPPASPAPNTTVSYWYKAAVDAAWFGGPDGKGSKYRKESDFKYPADQIIFYENAGWHWGEENKGLVDGVTVNVTYLDGHVSAERIVDSGQLPERPDPTAPGEPAWNNFDLKKFKPAKNAARSRYWDPSIYGDAM